MKNNKIKLKIRIIFLSGLFCFPGKEREMWYAQAMHPSGSSFGGSQGGRAVDILATKRAGICNYQKMWNQLYLFTVLKQDGTDEHEHCAHYRNLEYQ